MSRLCEICGGKIMCPDPVNPHLCSECGQDIGALRFWEKLVDDEAYDDDIEILIAKEELGEDV